VELAEKKIFLTSQRERSADLRVSNLPTLDDKKATCPTASIDKGFESKDNHRS
jgi:hypothetical protein